MLHAIQWSRSLENELQIILFNLQRCPLFCPSSITFQTVNHIILYRKLHLKHWNTETWWYNSKYDTFFRDVSGEGEWERERERNFIISFKSSKWNLFILQQTKNTDFLMNVGITESNQSLFHIIFTCCINENCLSNRDWKKCKKFYYCCIESQLKSINEDIFITMLYFIRQ